MTSVNSGTVRRLKEVATRNFHGSQLTCALIGHGTYTLKAGATEVRGTWWAQQMLNGIKKKGWNFA